jgi:hypothetical protein
VEILSRVEKNKAVKQTNTSPIGWLGWLFCYVLIAYLILRYIDIPPEIDFRQPLEIGLFFSSILFFDMYLLAFTLVSTKEFTRYQDKAARAKLYIIAGWVISMFYHFALWLMSQSMLHSLYYYIGILLTLGILFLTLTHFFSYFSFVKRDHSSHAKKRYLQHRREAYEQLKQVFYLYHLVRDLMDKDAEVKQMMRWNLFDQKMDNMLAEVEPYLSSSSFTREDLEKILGVKAWMDNLLLIIQQHPLHKNLNQNSDL